MTRKKLGKILLLVVLLTVYLNIGWGLGHYFHYNVDVQTFESASWHAKLLAGHCAFFAENEIAAKKVGEHNLLLAKIACSIFWPFVLLLSVACWIIHIVFWFISWLVHWIIHLGFWILKLIFWGGLVRLIFGIP